MHILQRRSQADSLRHRSRQIPSRASLLPLRPVAWLPKRLRDLSLAISLNP
ncbi:unnamed protein product [Ixodes pacificus]